MSLRILIGNAIAQKVQVLVCLITFIHHVTCFIWYLYVAIKSNKWLNIERIVLCSLFMMMVFSTFLVIWASDVLPKSSCDWIVNSNAILLSLTRLALYYFFLERLFLLFNHTDLEFAQFKRYQINISRFLIILWGIITTILLLLTGSDNAYYNDISLHCGTNYPIFVFCSIFIADLLISITISILLARRLKMIESHSNKSNLLKKFMLLSVIAIITTQFSAIMWILLGLGAIWSSFDSIINIWCILLTLDINKVSYNRICSKLHACIGNKCLSCYTCNYCWKIQMNEELEMVVIEGTDIENGSLSAINGQNITLTIEIHTNSIEKKTDDESIKMEDNNKDELINNINSNRNLIDCVISKKKQESLFIIYKISPAKCINKCIEMGLKDQFIDKIIAEFEMNHNKH